jgi:hypothetical protein
LQRLTESLGEKLKPCLVYLGKHRNEAFVAETERSPVLVTEFVVSVLKSAEKCSAEVAILLFKILQMVVPKEPGPQVQQLSRISMSVLRRSREHAERFAEIIVHLVSCVIIL